MIKSEPKNSFFSPEDKKISERIEKVTPVKTGWDKAADGRKLSAREKFKKGMKEGKK